MKANSDSFFSIGQNHVRQGTACQDYALNCSGAYPGSQMICISDGCSSSPDTDIGARLLCQRLKHRFQLSGKIHFIKEELWSCYKMLARDPILNDRCLDATLCYATYIHTADNTEDIKVTLTGDGSFYVLKRDGTIKLYSIEWSANMPPYLNYISDCFRERVLLDTKQTGKAEITTIRPSGVVTTFEQELNMQEVLYNGFSHTFNSEDVLCISVMSDGMGQVKDHRLIDAVALFNDFKSFEGCFVKRRAIRALQNLVKVNEHPNDDIAIATIHFDNTEDTI